MNTVFGLHKSKENNYHSYHSSREYNKIIHGAVQVMVASVLLVIALCCSAYAVNIDATVPASLPITVSADGTVTTATNAAIRNYGSSPIVVSSINVTAQNGWSLVTKDEATAAAIGDKVISMGVNGSWMDASGAIDTSSFNRVAASNSLGISYEAKIPGTMTSESESMAATTTFVVRLPPEPPTIVAGSSWYKSSVAPNTITKITFADSYTPSTAADETWTADVNGTGDITCYRTGTEIIIAGNGAGKIQSNTDSSYMFSNLTYGSTFRCLTSIENLPLLDTSDVINMSNMFYRCSNLVSLDVSKFDTTLVTDMSNMFSYCSSLVSLDVSKFDTTLVTDMSSMFEDCWTLKNLYVLSFNTSNVTDMSHMFSGCSRLTRLDLSSFDTANVTDMHNMFCGIRYLTSIDLSKFNTSNVTDMSSMFADCENLIDLNLSCFNTSQVDSLAYMFSGCRSLVHIDLSNFNTSNVTKIYSMFSDCPALVTIYASAKWSTRKVVVDDNMFTGCIKLQGDITYNSNYTDSTYARTSGGYLTYKAAASKTLSLSIDPNTGTVTSYDVFSSPIEQFHTTLIRSKMATAA